jgi:FdhD protein
VPPRPRSIDLTQVTEWRDGTLRHSEDYLVAEEPLEIRVDSKPLVVTMRTPGQDLELAAGFLFTEGLLQTREQIRALAYGNPAKESSRGNIIEVQLIESAPKPQGLARDFAMTSSCGICGKASIEAVRRKLISRPNARFTLDPLLLLTLPDKLKAAQTIFDRTGGLHAAALFSREGELIALREDVGRHNAVDKVVGWALLDGRLPLADCALVVSGRGGFEIVQKALMAGIPLLASVSAPSGLAVELARETGMTLVGFLRGSRFLVYSGEHRLRLATPFLIGNTPA